MTRPTKLQLLHRGAIADPTQKRIISFFQPRENLSSSSSSSVGRPIKKTHGGRPPQNKDTTPPEPNHVNPAPVPSEPQPRRKRRNFNTGEDKVLMEEAVEAWCDPDAEFEYCSGKKMSQNDYAKSKNIPKSTFAKHVKAFLASDDNDDGVRVKKRKVPGKPHLISDDTQLLIVEFIVRMDRANRPLTKNQIVTFMMDVCPNLSRIQCLRTFDQTIRKRYKTKLSNIVKAQQTSMNRNAITIQQQYRWHKTIDQVYAELARLNQGVDSQGKSFGERKGDCVCGGDETCLLAQDGKVKIIGEKDRKKHESTNNAGRISITMYRTGFASGAVGPTAFLPPGKRRDANYTDAYLEKYGAAFGSTVVMTDSGYMTEDAWEAITPSQIRGIRKVVDNDDWWAVLIVDGFAAHCINPNVMQQYRDAKIIVVKEEADSSHVNQSYDQWVAVSDKRYMREALALFNQASSSAVMTGWDLIFVGLHAIRHCDPNCWIDSFKKVNLHPDFRVDFGAWCKRIEQFLQPGQSFKVETAKDIYPLLAPFWHGMAPVEKRLAYDIVMKDHAGSYTVQCVQDLQTKCLIPSSDLQSLRICLDAARDAPAHLDMTAPQATTEVLDQVESQSLQSMQSANKGLLNFQAVPKGLDGKIFTFSKDENRQNQMLFEHMVRFRNRFITNDEEVNVSSYLDVEVR